MRHLDLSGYRPFVIVFLISASLVTLFAGAAWFRAKAGHDASAMVTHTYEVIRLARAATLTMQDMEKNQRNYLLIGDKEFFNAYKRAHEEFKSYLGQLQSLISDNPPQQRALENARAKAQILSDYFDKRAEQIGQQGRAVTLQDIRQGNALMDDFRATIDNFMIVEKSLLDSRQDAARKAEQQYYATLGLGAILALGGILLTHMLIASLIGKRREAEQALTKFQETYRLILDGVKDGIFRYEPQTGHMTFSASYKELLGYEPADLPPTTETLVDLLHPDDRETALQTIGKFMRREIPSYHAIFRLRHKDGNWRWVLARGVGLWDATGHMQCMVGTHTDITAQKKREEDAQQLSTDMAGVIYIVSHDLRAPLINLRGFASEIDRDFHDIAPLLEKLAGQATPEDAEKIRAVLNQDIPEALGFIRSGVERMDRLTNDVLDLSRIDRRAYQLEQVDAAAIMRRCIDSQTYEIKQRGVEVVCDNLPTVTTDPMALEQIFANILDNAIKYGAPDKPNVIRITARQLPWETIFSIQDSGRGIAPQDRQKVFDIFRRASNSGNVRGAGMGMAYVKAMLRRLGGRVWFESTLDQGTVFHIVIPAPVPQSAGAAA